jgi:hypothetical protein
LANEKENKNADEQHGERGGSNGQSRTHECAGRVSKSMEQQRKGRTPTFTSIHPDFFVEMMTGPLVHDKKGANDRSRRGEGKKDTPSHEVRSMMICCRDVS